jgi:glutathione S-transferase
MAELILHQYAMSPFSEKVRKVLAAKRLAWRAVEQPMWNPKPQLVPLTGGYRRIPVLQIGADVYCDTACILREIERRHPEPAVFPATTAGAIDLLAWWADRQLFTVAATAVLASMGPTMPPEFKADREKMVPGLNIDALATQAPHARDQLRAHLDALNARLAAHAFVLDETFTVADAACFHTLWFARMDPSAAALIAAAPAVAAWFARVEAMGHGTPQPMAADEALAIAARTEPTTDVASDPGDPSGPRAGDCVTVTPDDYGLDPVAGEIVAVSAREVAIRRRDAQVGEIVVHFPRAGFRLARA